MTPMRVIPAHAYRRMPWKNGGGVTTEIAVSPEGAGLDNFDWRISMAHVAQDGPFSAFPGVDRTLAVLNGLGITLRFAGRGEVTLGKMSDPYFFAADAAVEGKLHGEPIDDLNVMSRRAGWRHEVERRDIYEAWEYEAECDVAALVCVKGEVMLDALPLPLLRGGAGVGGSPARSTHPEALITPKTGRPPPPTPPRLRHVRLGEGSARGASLENATLLLTRGEHLTLTPQPGATLFEVRLYRLA